MSALEQAIKGLQVLQDSKNVDASVVAIYVYDYFLTFNEEISLVWFSKWSIVKVAFLLNRYLVIPGIILQEFVSGNFGWRGSEANCRVVLEVLVALMIVGVHISEAILCLRFWLMWNNNKKLIAATLVTFMGTGTYFLYFGEKRTLEGKFADSPMPGCAFIQAKSNVYVDLVVSLLYDLTMLTLTLIPAIRLFRSQTYFLRGSLIKRMYREGLQYYVFTVFWSAGALFLSIKSPENALTIAPLTRVTRSVLATRMVLHIRQMYQRGSYITWTPSVPSHRHTSL